MTTLPEFVDLIEKGQGAPNPTKYIAVIIECPAVPTPAQIWSLLKIGTVPVVTRGVFRCASTLTTDRDERRAKYARIQAGAEESFAGEFFCVEMLEEDTQEPCPFSPIIEGEDALTWVEVFVTRLSIDGAARLVMLAPKVGRAAYNSSRMSDEDATGYTDHFGGVDDIMTRSEANDRLRSTDYTEASE